VKRSKTYSCAVIFGRRAVLLASGLLLFLLGTPANNVFAHDVLIIGDVQYKPVAEVSSGIKTALKVSAKIYSVSEIKGRLARIAEKEESRIVVALGKDAVAETINLPSSIAVIYGLVIAPPNTSRHNTTGVYMSTPVIEYVNFIKRYLPSIKKISVVGSQGLLNILNGKGHANVSAYKVGDSAELVNTLGRMGDTQAILLLPDVSMLSASVMENVYLFSYRRKIPLLGISESSVKQGSLFALVFDPDGIVEQIAELAGSIMKGTHANELPPSAPRKFRLSLNINTARKMGITITEGMLNNAHKIYE
jgi:ABC-type uncharacterized transport system substrate-binding protein